MPDAIKLFCMNVKTFAKISCQRNHHADSYGFHGSIDRTRGVIHEPQHFTNFYGSSLLIMHILFIN